ncbi:hypothetical protein NliqN6_5939 [Naganishia liquefaciens]|uniref:Uncharacterized protein n=1 Tax=Naganishia liquefaciens TaxID=104408 RepID=A0A8H3TYP4_9TREE|nr:hypothetical protein NliqN6_5939 [Naganishia liquefaciens]
MEQINDDITDRLVELVGHCSGFLIPSRVLPSFTAGFQEFGYVPYVTLSKTFQVGILVDQCLPDELGSIDNTRDASMAETLPLARPKECKSTDKSREEERHKRPTHA